MRHRIACLPVWVGLDVVLRFVSLWPMCDKTFAAMFRCLCMRIVLLVCGRYRFLANEICIASHAFYECEHNGVQ